MDKLVFVNDEIFQSDGDYVIGGFTTDKTDNFTISDFKSELKERLGRLIDDYLERATIYNAEMGYENPSGKAHEDLALVIHDNLKISVPYTDKQTFIQSIFDCEQLQTWVENVQISIKQYDYSNQMKFIGIHNQALDMNRSSEQYMMAKYFTEETTFEQLIEQISIIEL